MSEILSNPKTIKARKQHKCSFCNGLILNGETYIGSKFIQDGMIYHWKSHIYCNAVFKELISSGYFVDDGDGMTEETFGRYVRNLHDDLMGYTPGFKYQVQTLSKNLAKAFEKSKLRSSNLRGYTEYILIDKKSKVGI